MDLQGENRILVKEGLLRLPHTKIKGLKGFDKSNWSGKSENQFLRYWFSPLVRALMPAED